jgi:hypothetical protein
MRGRQLSDITGRHSSTYGAAGATVRARLSMLAIDLVDLAAITLRVDPYKVYRV